MALHRLTAITLGVPNVEETAAYYNEFGLTPDRAEQVSIYGAEVPVPRDVHRFHTADGGEQLRVRYAEHRRLLELGVGAEDPEDLERIARNLTRLDVAFERTETSLVTHDPGTGARIAIELAPPLVQPPAESTPYNGPGYTERVNVRAPGVLRDARTKPRSSDTS